MGCGDSLRPALSSNSAGDRIAGGTGGGLVASEIRDQRGQAFVLVDVDQALFFG